jgi:acetate kinase
MVVYTGGIGENDGEVRASICAGLTWAGISLDTAQSLDTSRVLVKVLPSQEDEQIARHTWALSQSS